MRHSITAGAAVVVVTITLMGQARGQTYRLDLTTSAVAGSTSDSATVESDVPGGTVRQLPLSIRLLARDRGEYRNGSDIVYEVEVRNVGNDTFAMPWSGDQSAFEGVLSRSAMTISLEVNPGNDQTRIVVNTLLMAAESVPNSSQQLMPGDRAIVKAQGTVHVWPDQIKMLVAAGAMPVRARLRFQTPDARWEPVVSASTLPILLRSPSPHR